MVRSLLQWSCLVIAFGSSLVSKKLVLVFQDVHFDCIVLLEILYLVVERLDDDGLNSILVHLQLLVVLLQILNFLLLKFEIWCHLKNWPALQLDLVNQLIVSLQMLLDAAIEIIADPLVLIFLPAGLFFNLFYVLLELIEELREFES